VVFDDHADSDRLDAFPDFTATVECRNAHRRTAHLAVRR
jgi:hypothetical protein